jgi:HEXXH motif-containing protein
MAPFSDVTLPAPSSATARTILSRALDRLRSDLGRIDFAPEVKATVARLLKAKPGAVFAALRQPTVGAFVRVLRSGADPALAADLAATLAFELAALEALDRPLTLTLDRRALSLVGRSRVEPGRVTFTAGRVELDGHARAIEPRLDLFAPIADTGIVLALDDSNPLAMLEAHPKKSGNAIDLGERDASTWTNSLAEALSIVERYLPDLHRELCLFIRQIVPVGFDADAHLSASYREAIGTIYLSLHPNAMTMAEALIHEFSHNKLNALFEIDPVLENPPEAVYASPVRPDPRPIAGVLLAVHAFVPVARLYERMIEAGDPRTSDPGFARRYRDIASGNAEGMAVLREHAIPTEQGSELLEELERAIGR